MSRAVSQHYAAAVAARAALEAGETRLGIALVAHVAGRGVDWQTYKAISEEIRRPDGRPYHRESIGRKFRELAARGRITSRRVMPGGALPKRAKFERTGHGTTVKVVQWRAFSLAPPRVRGERVREARRQRATEPKRFLTAAETLGAIAAARERMNE